MIQIKEKIRMDLLMRSLCTVLDLLLLCQVHNISFLRVIARGVPSHIEDYASKVNVNMWFPEQKEYELTQPTQSTHPGYTQSRGSERSFHDQSNSPLDILLDRQT